ncbi:hypothetical protein HCU74_08250 [Spongiibacter sp. KMU-166]|uniref:Uncharacterized protein n=1 Tax=Spongiibacter thalassae TaxID=2721624 RepID=A0ABX1GE22_9GAMM|nr:hypothetical protein [Spongiibacter thalassae]NKI17406.1 hypothetical protein [Spongiibacter thalassae]
MNTTDTTLRRIERKWDTQALQQLRETAAALYDELEDTKRRLAWAEEEAEMCRQERDMLHDTINDAEFSTHRRVGLTPSGEMVVVKLEH